MAGRSARGRPRANRCIGPRTGTAATATTAISAGAITASVPTNRGPSASGAVAPRALATGATLLPAVAASRSSKAGARGAAKTDLAASAAVASDSSVAAAESSGAAPIFSAATTSGAATTTATGAAAAGPCSGCALATSACPSRCSNATATEQRTDADPEAEHSRSCDRDHPHPLRPWRDHASGISSPPRRSLLSHSYPGRQKRLFAARVRSEPPRARAQPVLAHNPSREASAEILGFPRAE